MTDKRYHFTDDTKKERLIPVFSYDGFIREARNHCYILQKLKNKENELPVHVVHDLIVKQQ